MIERLFMYYFKEFNKSAPSLEHKGVKHITVLIVNKNANCQKEEIKHSQKLNQLKSNSCNRAAKFLKKFGPTYVSLIMSHIVTSSWFP